MTSAKTCCAAAIITMMMAAVETPQPVAAREWLGGIAATLRHEHAPPGEYRYGKAVVTFDGKHVIKLTTPQIAKRSAARRQ